MHNLSPGLPPSRAKLPRPSLPPEVLSGPVRRCADRAVLLQTGVVQPLGYGKTVAVVDRLANFDAASAWYVIDEDDNDQGNSDIISLQRCTKTLPCVLQRLPT